MADLKVALEVQNGTLLAKRANQQNFFQPGESQVENVRFCPY